MATVSSSPLKVPRFRRSDPRPASGSISPKPETRPLADGPRNGHAPVVAGTAPSHQSPMAGNRIRVLEHPLAQHAMTVLRNRHTPPPRFREVCNHLLVLLALEAVRNMKTREEPVETSGGLHVGQALEKPVVLFTLDRHSLGLAHSMVDFLPGARVGSITLDRSADGQDLTPRLHLNSTPVLDCTCAILFEPVVASGGSASLAVDLLRRSGARDIIMISFLGSLAGLSRLQSSYPEMQVWTAAIDTELDPKHGPVPGLGNFAERLYG